MFRGIIFGLFAITTLSFGAEETGDSLVQKMLEREKLLLQHRAKYAFTVVETREKLNSEGKVASSSDETMAMQGGQRVHYGPPKSEGVEADLKQAAKEEPFNILNIIHHYTFTRVGDENMDGAPCFKVKFDPKENQPFHNRNEKVANELAGFLWISKADYTLVRNDGELTQPVSVAWFFATLRELEFSFQAKPISNGEFAPSQIQYRFRVQVLFAQIHERHIRRMKDYHVARVLLPGG